MPFASIIVAVLVDVDRRWDFRRERVSCKAGVLILGGGLLHYVFSSFSFFEGMLI